MFTRLTVCKFSMLVQMLLVHSLSLSLSIHFCDKFVSRNVQACPIPFPPRMRVSSIRYICEQRERGAVERRSFLLEQRVSPLRVSRGEGQREGDVRHGNWVTIRRSFCAPVSSRMGPVGCTCRYNSLQDSRSAAVQPTSLDVAGRF